ncbi:MAG: S1 family peptidase [Sandaracinaceae bacterium]|nr:S1 family peptidase [Sandaracinaceae bacterium]
MASLRELMERPSSREAGLRAADHEVQQWFHAATAEDPDVVGWGYGRKRVGGVATRDTALVIFVVKKRPLPRIAPVARVPAQIAGLPSDVVRVGHGRALNGIETLPRPVPWGCRISHVNGDEGTLGCIARRGRELFILSNAHVLSPPGARRGSRILQPAASAEPERSWIGRLAAAVEIETTATTPLARQWNVADAAIASLRRDPAEPGGYVATHYAPKWGLDLTSWRARRDVPLGLRVAKVGAMTGMARGRVVYVHASIKVPMGPGVALFREQIVTTDIGEPGDSGSLVVCRDGSAIGLLFGQAPIDGGTYSLVSPIETIQDALDVRVAPKRWTP